MSEQTLSKTKVTPPVTVTIPRKRQLLYVLLAAVVILALTYLLPPFRNYQLATAGAYLCVTAGLTVLPRTGHTANLEEPDVFNRAVDSFLSSVYAVQPSFSSTSISHVPSLIMGSMVKHMPFSRRVPRDWK